MKLLVFVCLLGLAMAGPQHRPPPRQQQQFRENVQVNPNNYFRTLRDERTPVIGANFRYLYETDNGIFAQKEGTPGSQGQSNMAGSFSFRTPEGENVEVRYVADEFGYRPESAHIPTPHPLPAHALEQIRIAEQQRAQGIRWDERGFRI